jgi:hypothetical protein
VEYIASTLSNKQSVKIETSIKRAGNKSRQTFWAHDFRIEEAKPSCTHKFFLAACFMLFSGWAYYCSLKKKETSSTSACIDTGTTTFLLDSSNL